jgi:hypothetical protein
LLLASDAHIEQTAAILLTYRIVCHGDSVTLTGGIVQRLQSSHKVSEPNARVNGKNRLYLVETASVPARGYGLPPLVALQCSSFPLPPAFLAYVCVR